CNVVLPLVFGACVQMLLASEFGVQGQWINVDCSVKQPYICFPTGVDNCLSKPCQNGGQCLTDGDSNRCACPEDTVREDNRQR
ncbi:hypothetical protein PENTCL1PPCAC_25703, partial [Pristionchus entomophagus]